MRVGFCCKWIGDEVPNTRTTTLTWLNRQTIRDAEIRLTEIMHHNLEATKQLVLQVASGPEITRMVRLTSDMLPMFTEPKWSYFYQKQANQVYLEAAFNRIGEIARLHGVRLSFHPGQFTVLASDRPDVVDKSIAEFEYHCDMIRWMGYGKTFQDFKCNVHIAGARGAQGIIDVLPRLSEVARNVITIENSETTWGLDESLKLAEHCALVLDIHHHWVKDGEYIDPQDARVLQVIQSWRGVRPVIHYSNPKEDILAHYEPNAMLVHEEMINDGHHKMALRAHSDSYINHGLNKWAASFLPMFDIQTESKLKNVARDAFLKDVGLLNV